MLGISIDFNYLQPSNIGFISINYFVSKFVKLMCSNGLHPLNGLAFLLIDDTSKLEKSIIFIYYVFSSYSAEKKFS